MKLGMEINVYASLGTTKSMDYAEPAILIQPIMEKTVSVILVSTEIETNVKNAINLVENAADLLPTNAPYVLMSAIP